MQAYNRFLEPYFELLMDEELQQIASNPDYSRKKYEAIKQMKENHIKSVQILDDAIKHAREEKVKLSDIFIYCKQLFALKLSGPQFEQMMKNANWTKLKEPFPIPEKELDLMNKTLQRTTTTESTMSRFWKQFLPQL